MPNEKTVLIVDDAVHIRLLLEIKLQRYGYTTLQARNGSEGLDIIKAKHPQVVICDINMPVMDGKTMVKLSNPLKEKRSFLTIVITARISPQERQWIETMQETLFFEKPFSPAEILQAVNVYMEKQP